ncbi:MAG: HD domain-containing protein [Baekduia sp.]
MGAVTTREEAFGLLCDWVGSESLRRHCLAVEAAMVWYAENSGEDAERWAIAGLLHDADYEQHPDMDDLVSGHPRTIIAHLQATGGDDDVIDAIAGHAPFLGVARSSAMAKTLFAVDELAGFIVACCAVRPGGIEGLTAKSVKKKLKSPAFAAAVSREDISLGAEQLGLPLDEHITNVIAALAARSAELGLDPAQAGSGT